MGLDDLAKLLADTSRLGMTPTLAESLQVKSADVLRGQLMSITDGPRGPLGVHLLAIYIVDDTDFFDDGEIYWWSIPVLVDKKGHARWGAVSGLPAGSPPHKCGSLEWMTNVSLQEPPLLAVIPADDDTASCVIRLGIYDDDKKPANLGLAMSEGFEALARCKREGLAGADQVITPVREAIYKGLAAHDDDVILDDDITIRRGEAARFNVGFIGSSVTAKGRAYFVVKDELRTETAGPIVLHKGEETRLTFKGPVELGGRVSVFARGADVDCPILGDFTTDRPFAGKVLDTPGVKLVAGGIQLKAKGAAKVVAFYTPP